MSKQETKETILEVEFYQHNLDSLSTVLESDYLSEEKIQDVAKMVNLVRNLADLHISSLRSISKDIKGKKEREKRSNTYSAEKNKKLELIQLLTQF